MGVSQQKRPVSYEKLIAEFKRRGLTPGEVADGIAYTRTVFAPSKVAPGLTEKVLVALRSVYGIQYEDIAPDPEPVQAEPVKAEQMTITPDPVEVKVEITPDAIAEALVIVLTNQAITDQLVKIVYTGVNAAIRKNAK